MWNSQNGSGWAKLELAYAYAVAGNKAESDRIVNEVTSQPGPFSPYDMATICAAWHDSDGAFHWLEKAIEQRSVDVIWIRVDPRLDHIRVGPAFWRSPGPSGSAPPISAGAKIKLVLAPNESSNRPEVNNYGCTRKTTGRKSKPSGTVQTRTRPTLFGSSSLILKRQGFCRVLPGRN